MPNKLFLTVLTLVLSTAPLVAQDNDDAEPVEPCSLPEFRQFDFWLGEWHLTWDDSGRGTNTITLVMDSCVVQEHFKVEPQPGFRGQSVSTYDTDTHQWRQTWVDNQRGYLDFVGGWAGDRMVLWREAASDTGSFLQRMVWYDISQNSMEWNWEKSRDGGTTWETLWNIHYQRAEQTCVFHCSVIS